MSLEKLISAWTLNYTSAQIENRLQDAGIPSNVVEKHAGCLSRPPVETAALFRTPRSSGNG